MGQEVLGKAGNGKQRTRGVQLCFVRVEGCWIKLAPLQFCLEVQKGRWKNACNCTISMKRSRGLAGRAVNAHHQHLMLICPNQRLSVISFRRHSYMTEKGPTEICQVAPWAVLVAWQGANQIRDAQALNTFSLDLKALLQGFRAISPFGTFKTGDRFNGTQQSFAPLEGEIQYFHWDQLFLLCLRLESRNGLPALAKSALRPDNRASVGASGHPSTLAGPAIQGAPNLRSQVYPWLVVWIGGLGFEPLVLVEGEWEATLNT